MLQDKTGNRLFRKVEIKVVYPEGIFPPKVFVQHAGPKQGFNPDGIDEMLMQTATRLDDLYPWWNFKVVELAPIGRTARFVFTFAGYRSVSAPPNNEFVQDSKTADSTTLEPETAESELTTEAIKAAVGTTLQDLSS